MSAHVIPRSLPEDNKSTIMVVTVSAGLMIIVMGIIGYVMFVAKPRPARNNVIVGRPVRSDSNVGRTTLHYTNGSWEHFPETPVNQGYAVEYLRFILQRARGVTGRDNAPDGEAQNGDQNQNASGHGQNSGGQGHNSGGHNGTA